MKLSLTHNDRTTAGDEIALIVITLVIIACGILLLVYKPIFYELSIGLGVLLLVAGGMYIPCIIYRLWTNNRDSVK